MTGTAKVKPAKNNQEWARNTEARLGAAENPTSTRVGDWVFSTQPGTGNLLASHIDGGSVVLAGKPSALSSPDDVQVATFPAITVQRTFDQVEANGSAHLVLWDTLVLAGGGFTFSPTGSEIVVPVDGHYLCSYYLAFKNATALEVSGVFYAGGLSKMARSRPNSDYSALASLTLTKVLPLQAGTIITAAAYMAGSGTFAFGASTADPQAHTTLSLVRLPIG